MSPETIIAQLEQINSWRRGEESEPQPDPKHVGEVIDAAVASLASLIASNTTLCRERREARAEVAQLKGALALGQENCNAEYEELREERDEAKAELASVSDRLSGAELERDRLGAELAKATADRDNWKRTAEYHDQAFREEARDHDDSNDELAALRARNAELVAALAGCADALREAGKDFAQANKLAARPNLYELHEQIARAALARAESATPAKHPDTERLDWLLDLIRDKGTNGVAAIKWTNPAESDPMEENDWFLNRAAIDAARKQGGEE